MVLGSPAYWLCCNMAQFICEASGWRSLIHDTIMNCGLFECT